MSAVAWALTPSWSPSKYLLWQEEDACPLGLTPVPSYCHSCSHKGRTQSGKANTHLLFESQGNFLGTQYTEMSLFPS